MIAIHPLVLALLMSYPPVVVERATLAISDSQSYTAGTTTGPLLPNTLYLGRYDRFNLFELSGPVLPRGRHETRVLYHGRWHRAVVVAGRASKAGDSVTIVIHGESWKP